MIGIINKQITKLLKSPETILLTILIIVTISLRLPNLSYSDYIQDEVASFFYWGGQKNVHMSRLDFLLNEPRPPMNVIMGAIPHAIVGNYDNAFAHRLPFALFGIFSIIIFYYLVKKLTGSYFVAFLSAYLLSTNGLIVAYSRVSLYESILFFFMYASLYYFADLLEEKISQGGVLKSTLIGSLLFCIAFYSHWDAIYMLIPVGFILLKFFFNKKFGIGFKMLVAASNLLLIVIILFPYFVPYFQNLLANNERNVEYAGSFVGLDGQSFSKRGEIKQFVLYNPFLSYYLYLIFAPLGIFFSKKKPIFGIWLITLLIFFRYFVTYSGLHFYNLFFPTVVLIAIAFKHLTASKYHLVKVFSFCLLIFTLFFFFIQSYLVFVDHKREYPMEREKVLFWKTRKYTHKDELKHKTGFPHKRYWFEINEYVMEQNRLNGESFGYHTNEDKGIARIYMKTHNTTGDYFYAIGVKRPNSFAFDYKFPQFNPKSTVHKIKNEYGDTVVQIFRVEVRKK